MVEVDISMPKLFAAVIGSYVERKSLDDGLKEVGLSEDILLSEWLSPASPKYARDYTRDLISRGFLEMNPAEGGNLYLVKKVLCSNEEFADMEKAVNGNDTDKFKVLRLIGSNKSVMGYKQENNGFEAYLASGKNPLSAMKQTTTGDPFFNFSATGFDASDAQKLDEVLNKTVYEHTPKSIEELFNLVGLTFGPLD